VDRRGRLFAVVLAAVLAVALVLLVAGGDEDVTQGPATTVERRPAAPGPQQERRSSPPGEQEEEARPRQAPPEVLTSGPRRDVARAISDLVQAVELGDGEAFCNVVGRSAGQAEGLEALRACGRQAGIDPFSLPTSDELSVQEVRVRGAGAVARLGGGQRVTLRRAGGRWRVRSFTPAGR